MNDIENDTWFDKYEEVKAENEKLKRQLETAKKVAVYFYGKKYGVRPSIWSLNLIKNYIAALKQSS